LAFFYLAILKRKILMARLLLDLEALFLACLALFSAISFLDGPELKTLIALA